MEHQCPIVAEEVGLLDVGEHEVEPVAAQFEVAVDRRGIESMEEVGTGVVAEPRNGELAGGSTTPDLVAPFDNGHL